MFMAYFINFGAGSSCRVSEGARETVETDYSDDACGWAYIGKDSDIELAIHITQMCCS